MNSFYFFNYYLIESMASACCYLYGVTIMLLIHFMGPYSDTSKFEIMDKSYQRSSALHISLSHFSVLKESKGELMGGAPCEF